MLKILKCLFILGYIAVISALFFVLYLLIYKPTNSLQQDTVILTLVNPYENWHIYENQAYGFSFKYPSNFLARIDSESKTGLIAYFGENGANHFSVSIDNGLYTNQGGEDLEESIVIMNLGERKEKLMFVFDDRFVDENFQTEILSTFKFTK